jgi:hypothetical protein
MVSVGQAERLTCRKCGADLMMALPAGAKEKRTFQCEKCQPGDPLRSDKASGWIRSGELRPPK